MSLEWGCRVVKRGGQAGFERRLGARHGGIAVVAVVTIRSSVSLHVAIILSQDIRTRAPFCRHRTRVRVFSTKTPSCFLVESDVLKRSSSRRIRSSSSGESWIVLDLLASWILQSSESQLRETPPSQHARSNEGSMASVRGEERSRGSQLTKG